MALDANEGLQTALEMINLGMKIGATMKTIPADATGLQEAAIVVKAHANEAMDLAVRIEERVKS